MDKLQKTRLDWIKLYQEVKDAGIVCSRCGISRPTLRKWLKRYAEEGITGRTSARLMKLDKNRDIMGV